MAVACSSENAAPVMWSIAATDTALLDAAGTRAAPAPGDVMAHRCVVLESLASLVPRGSDWWYRAVAPAVTALGAIVNSFIDVRGVRMRPTYAAVVHTLRYCGLGGKVPAFQAAWEALRATPDGCAVIIMCQAAAEGGALLGRLSLTKMAEDREVEAQLAAYYADAAFMPVLVAAERYYRGHAAPPAAMAAAPEWPPLKSLLSHRYAPPCGGPPPQKWLLAVAPAMAVLERIMGHLLDVTATPLTPTHDRIVDTLQVAAMDELVPSFEAAWDALRSTRNGRAVIAVCEAARNGGVMLGWHAMSEVAASVPDLKSALRKEYAGEEYLPVLLAAAEYYLDVAADAPACAASCE